MRARSAGSRRLRSSAIVAAIAVVLLFAMASAALGLEAPIPPKEVNADAAELEAVIEGLRGLLVGLLAATATLFLTVGGFLYMCAGGDPGQIARAKNCWRCAAVGYVLAAMAGVFVEVLQGVIPS